MYSTTWRAFHAAHFEDPARRAWFAEHIARQPPAHTPPPVTLQEREDRWTTLAYDEDEAAWQKRHHVQYLTPGAARIFDTSRRFREARLQEQTDHDLKRLRQRVLDDLVTRKS